MNNLENRQINLPEEKKEGAVEKEKQPITCVISCSFRYLDQIRDLKSKLEAIGVKVLAPIDTEVEKSVDGFAILKADKTDDPAELEMAFMNAIGEADFLYILIPEDPKNEEKDGVVGASVAAEIASASCRGIPVIISRRWKGFSDQVEEEFKDEFDNSPFYYNFSGGLSPEQLVERIQQGELTKKSLNEAKKRKLDYFELFGIDPSALKFVKKQKESKK